MFCTFINELQSWQEKTAILDIELDHILAYQVARTAHRNKLIIQDIDTKNMKAAEYVIEHRIRLRHLLSSLAQL